MVPRAALMSSSPARALLISRECLTVTPLAALTCTPTPALLATVTRSSTMRLALSIQTAWGAAARTVKPRRTTSRTPVSMMLTVPAGAAIVTGPSAW